MLPAAQILLIGIGAGGHDLDDTWRKTGARARKEAAAIGAGEIRRLVRCRTTIPTAPSGAHRRRRATGRLSIQQIPLELASRRRN